MTLVNEGLKAGDLEGVVSKRFSVDQFKSKMGDDRNIMVLAFTVDGMAPAKDLERFAETGYKEVLDADATPGTLEDGKHKVFVEFARVESVDQHIRKFLDDLKKLTNIELPKPRVMSVRTFYSNKNKTNIIDRCMVVWMPGPKSYTGQDSVEIYCHGSRAVVSAFLECLESFNNLRLAKEGEFTKTALVNGKINCIC